MLLLYSLFSFAQEKRKKRNTHTHNHSLFDITAYYRTVFLLSSFHFYYIDCEGNESKSNQIGTGPLSSLGASGPLSSLGSGQYNTKFSTVFSMFDEFIGCENYYYYLLLFFCEAIVILRRS